MIKITKGVEQFLGEKMQHQLGYYSDSFGAIIGDNEFILAYLKDDCYLVHITEFEQNGIFIKLKNKDNKIN